jgi:hypothetical protein
MKAAMCPAVQDIVPLFRYTEHIVTLDFFFLQVFTENMGKKSEPQVTVCLQGINWTRITFKPDLAKFRACLVPKNFQDFRHIESLDACMKH